MVVNGDLGLDRRLAFDCAFHTATTAVPVPDAVVKTKLHFLFHVAGKIVGRDPTCMYVESGFTFRVIFVNHAQLGRIPGSTVPRADDPTLARAGDTLERAAKCKVNQLQIVYRDIRPRVPPGDPFGELFAGNYLRHPAFDELKDQEGYRVIGNLENSDKIMNQSFWVGVYPGMKDEMLNYTIEKIRIFCDRSS